MIELCGFECSKIEKDLPTPSYTYQTINALYNGEKINFIIGADQFIQLDKWKNYEQIIDRCKFYVMKRDNIIIPKLNVEYEILPFGQITASSTEIRENHDYVLVPNVVEDYIIKHNLY